ncbi:hypothetical protein [Aeromicrobium alkaliterrae]|uniref:Uncharacterized protein n=1 Tax=Aeromicrobium alkaliterrae TaxID=302168 RepID=A0ABP4W1V7_9ACTN
MTAFRLLGLVVMASAVALFVGGFGPWVVADSGELSDFEAGSAYPGTALPIWAGLLAMWSVRPAHARRWFPWAVVTIAALASLTSTIDLVRIAGSTRGGEVVTVGWGLWATVTTAQVLLVVSTALAVVSRRVIPTEPPPRPAPWGASPGDPLRSALSVAALGTILSLISSFGPWGAGGGDVVASRESDRVAAIVLMILVGVLLVGFAGPPRATPALRPFVLPLAAAALTASVLTLAHADGASDLSVSWGAWLAVLGAGVTCLGGILLLFVPLPDAGIRARPWFPLRTPAPQFHRAGPPLPPPPAA